MSFAAGFAKGFTTTLVKGIEDSKERMQDLVDQAEAMLGWVLGSQHGWWAWTQPAPVAMD